MSGLTTQLCLTFLAGLIPSACASNHAANRPAAIEGSAPPVQAERVDRNVSALAYEHYLRARMQIEQHKLRAAIGELRQALVYDHHSPHLHVLLGQVYARQGLWRLASKEAKSALDIDPEHIASLLLKAGCLVQAGKRDEAIAVYRQVIGRDPKQIAAYTRLARLHLEAKDKQQAMDVLQRMIERNPDSADGFRRLGDLHFEQGNEALAEKNYRQVLQLEPSDTRTIQTLTGLLEQQGRYKEAIQVFIEALETSPENPYYMAYMARLYLKDGDQQAAQAYIEQMRASDPSNASLIARAYAEINRHAEAIEELETVLTSHPDEHNERLLVAILYEELKQWEKALGHLEKIPQGSRFYANAQTSIGYTLQNMGRYPEAERVLIAALDLTRDPDELGRIYRNLAIVYGKQKKFVHGLRVLDDAIGKHPALTDLHEAKASLQFEAGRAEDGVKTLERALASNQEDVSLLYALGAHYERMGKVAESIATMRKLLAIEPNNSSALNFIGYTLADQGQDLDEAEHMIRRALLLNPGNGAITDSLGWVLYRRGKFEEALDYLKRADRATPGEAVIIMHVGDAYLKLGQREQAIEQYRKALAAQPEPRDRQEILNRFKELGITL